MWKGILLETKVKYILYPERYEYECQIIIIIVNKPQINVAFLQDIYLIRFFFFLQKGKLVLRPLLSEGRYYYYYYYYYLFFFFWEGVANLGFANSCDVLSLLSEVRYFQGVVTFGTLRYQDNSSLLASSASIRVLIREGPSECGLINTLMVSFRALNLSLSAFTVRYLTHHQLITTSALGR